MKKIFLGILLFSLTSFIYASQNNSSNQVTITYLGNMGVFIQSGYQQVLIDALHKSNPWGYHVPGKKLLEKILNGKEGFTNTNILLNTHVHKDHFDSELVNEFLNSGNKKVFVTKQIYDELKDTHENFDKIKSALIINDNSSQGIIEETINNAKIKAINLSHGNSTQNTGYIVNINGFKIFHTGDAEYSQDNFTPYNLDKEKIDVALIPVWYLGKEGRKIIDLIKPKKVIIIHVAKQDVERMKKQ